MYDIEPKFCYDWFVPGLGWIVDELLYLFHEEGDQLHFLPRYRHTFQFLSQPNKQCSGFRMFISRIPDPTFSIPDPGWKWYRTLDPASDPQQKTEVILTLKRSWKHDLGCLSRIRIIFPRPGSRGQNSTKSRIRHPSDKYMRFIPTLFLQLVRSHNWSMEIR